MGKLNRFIQFNDESVDTHSLMLYEKIAQSLADAPFLHLTERQLMEYQPRESVLAMSVFWRHRPAAIMHLGRLSDLYLLAAGYYRHFDLGAWRSYSGQFRSSRLPVLSNQLVILFEEFRLAEQTIRHRPGTARAFTVRHDVYTAFHHDRLASNAARGFTADALLSQLFLDIHLGTLQAPHESLHSLPMARIRQLTERIYECNSTSDSIALARQIAELADECLEVDIILPLYTIGDYFEEGMPMETPSGSPELAGKGDPAEKQTIEEEFRAWHRETEDEKGTHLTFDIQHGSSGMSVSDDPKPGDDRSAVQQIGKGVSEGNEEELTDAAESDKSAQGRGRRAVAAGERYGAANKHVTYEIIRLEKREDAHTRRQLQIMRDGQQPFVKAVTSEMRKRLELKKTDRHEHLSAGRLSSKLSQLVTDDRPKPFYRKSSPSRQLDAVFGLLVDGSASMIDKLEETKEAVLLFHDILRSLAVPFEIAAYYEDAFEASKEEQPNFFEVMHSFEDRQTDSGPAILDFSAHEDNRDGFAIRWMADRLAERRERHKFLLVFSDGEPAAFGYARNGILDTAEAVWETEKRGISVIHLYLLAQEATEDQKALFSTMFGNKTAAADSVEQFTDQTLRILRKLLTIVTQ